MKRTVAVIVLAVVLLLSFALQSVFAAYETPIIEALNVRIQDGLGTVKVITSSEGSYSYSYYLLSNGEIIAKDVYSKSDTFDFALEDEKEYRLRVYVQSSSNKRAVLERKITNENIDEIGTPFEALYEAEDGVMEGNIKAASSRAGYSGTGYATGFHQGDDDYWGLSVQIPQAGHYTLTVKAASDSYKVNTLTVNGITVGDIITQGTGTFEDVVFEGVYLEEGENLFSIVVSWGWFDIDSILITSGEAIDSSYYNVTGTLSNENANEKTKNIMQYFTEIYGEKTIAGQYTNHGYNTEVKALYALTGKYPALRGFDFIFYSPNSTWPEGAKDVDLALEWDKKGGLSTFSWHWHAPIGESTFYTESTSFDLSKAVTTVDISQKSLTELKTMLDNGEITEECYYIVSDIDAISAQLKILENNNVTILWRPLHEASGGWFWWGAKGSEPYKWLWKLMYDRQTNYHRLNNLIWVWNAQDADWYPGDEYVDIAGIDIYAEAHDYAAQSDSFVKTAEMAAGKPVALTENGVVPDIELMERDNTHWLWFNTWCRDFVVDDSGNYVETYTEKDLIKKVYESDLIITLDELPEF